MIKFTVKGNMDKKISKAISLYSTNAIRHINRVANNFQSEIKLSMRNTKVDKTVTRYNPTRQARVSAKGNPPAIDTGLLVNSIFIKPASKAVMTAEVFTNNEYAPFLELDLDREFMGENSPAFKKAIGFSNKVIAQVKLERSKV